MNYPIVNRVREMRATQGLTRDDLARRAGVSRSTLAYIEDGANTTYETASRIALGLGVGVEAVFPTHDNSELVARIEGLVREAVAA